VRKADGSVEKIALPSQSLSEGGSHQDQVSQTLARGTTESLTQGETNGESTQQGVSHTQTTTRTGTESLGSSQQHGHSASLKLVPLARHRSEKQFTGSLKRSISDQLEEGRQKIAGLKTRQMIVKLQNQDEAIEVESLPMPHPFKSEEAHLNAIAWIKRQIFQIHPYNFVPDFRPEAEDRRLMEFLAVGASEEMFRVEHKTSAAVVDCENPLL